MYREGKKFNIDEYFDDFLKKPEVFKNRNVLDSSFIPNELPHRDLQIKSIAQNMACTLKNSIPSNMFLYGKPGTGKTAVIKHVANKLEDKCNNIGIKPPKWIYLNCTQINSSYRILATLCNQMDPSNILPPTGIPKDVLLEKLCLLLDDQEDITIFFIILDEIDYLNDKKSKDSILYTLSRINENLNNAHVNLIGISNILTFKDDLDPRVCSSLCEEELVFPAYNAVELYDILKGRVNDAFLEGIVIDSALRLCAAFAAKENGDARRALTLLRKAAEILERRGLSKLTEDQIYTAQSTISQDKISIYINDLPIQQKAILLSIYLNHRNNQGKDSSSGEIYSTYCELVKKIYGINQLTSRRVTSLAKEIELAGKIMSRIRM